MKNMLKIFSLIIIVAITSVTMTFYYAVKYDGINNEKRLITTALRYDTYISEETNVLKEIIGEMTGYAANCPGCLGTVFCAPYPDVRAGNITFLDQEYGEIRIVAADPSIPCGTIVRITTNLYGEPIIAIVLDRGSAIKGDIFDLLFKEDENINSLVGRQKNVKFEILRFGW